MHFMMNVCVIMADMHEPLLLFPNIYSHFHAPYAVRMMMYGFGDDECPMDETVDLVEVGDEGRGRGTGVWTDSTPGERLTWKRTTGGVEVAGGWTRQWT